MPISPLIPIHLLLTLFSPSSPFTDPPRGRGSRENMWYRVAKPSEYLAVTGYGIKDIKLARKAWILPGQSCITFDITPVNYNLEVQAVSADEVPFLMPGVFTIGPRNDNVESLRKYAQLLAPHHKLSSHVKDLVQGIIEGETGVVAGSMAMEEILKGIKEFKSQVFNKVQLELDQFGLLLYHANVRQLVDVNGHEYFSCLAQKTQMVLATNQANVDVADARMKGESGLMLKEGQKLQNAAKVDKIYSTQRQGESREAENRMGTEVNVFKNQWEAEVVKANVDTAINEYSHSHNHSCGQTEAPSHNHSHDHSSGQTEAHSSSCGQTETSWSSVDCGMSSW